MCLSARTVLFFLLINTLLASLLSISMYKFISSQLTAQGLVTGHWSLVVWWLGFSHLTATARPQSLIGNPNPASSCCRSRPPEISGMGWGQVTPLTGFQLISTYSHQAVRSDVTSRLISPLPLPRSTESRRAGVERQIYFSFSLPPASIDSCKLGGF